MAKIKFVAHVVLWRDKIDTYHSIRITRTRDGKVIDCPFQYGRHYRETALEKMAEVKWLPAKYRTQWWHYYELENGFPILWIITNGSKKCANHRKEE